MSAYGAISAPTRTHYLPSTIWPYPNSPLSGPSTGATNVSTISVHHIDLSAIEEAEHDGLFEYLHCVFADEVDKGMTYPQENVRDRSSFASYFFAADVMVAVTGTGDGIQFGSTGEAVVKEEVDMSLTVARQGRSWEECVAGFYYVKPNYPGRSSHICNAGFVVPETQRGRGYGRILAKSYLHYGQRLGYKASVFNLVYVNNEASVRLWEKLGFTKIGCIPNAGRLKRADGNGEEYVDCWVVYRSFEDIHQQNKCGLDDFCAGAISPALTS